MDGFGWFSDALDGVSGAVSDLLGGSSGSVRIGDSSTGAQFSWGAPTVPVPTVILLVVVAALVARAWR